MCELRSADENVGVGQAREENWQTLRKSPCSERHAVCQIDPVRPEKDFQVELVPNRGRAVVVRPSTAARRVHMFPESHDLLRSLGRIYSLYAGDVQKIISNWIE